MRVLFCIPGAGPIPSYGGGAVVKLTAELANRAAREHEVTVLGQVEPLDERVRVIPCGHEMQFSPKHLPESFSYIVEGLRSLRGVEADVVVSTHPRTLLLSWLYARKRGIPCVSWELDHDFWTPPDAWYKPPYRRLAARVDRVITESEEQRRRITGLGVPAGKTVVVPASVDTEKYRPGGPPGGESYILNVAKFVERKNQLLLLEAFGELASRREDLGLVLVGPRGGTYGAGSDVRTGYYGRCLDFIESSGLSGRVSILEEIPEEELIRLYRGCSLFAFPSTEEGFGLTLLEAMSCGCACLSNDIEPMRSILGDAGALTPVTGASSLSQELKRLLDDEALLERMGRDSRARAASVFDSERANEAFLRELELLVPRSRDGRSPGPAGRKPLGER